MGVGSAAEQASLFEVWGPADEEWIVVLAVSRNRVLGVAGPFEGSPGPFPGLKSGFFADLALTLRYREDNITELTQWQVVRLSEDDEVDLVCLATVPAAGVVSRERAERRGEPRSAGPSCGCLAVAIIAAGVGAAVAVVQLLGSAA